VIKTKKIEYRHENTIFQGLYAYDDSHTHDRPLILVAHDWSGRNEFADDKAKNLAELGYIGFAIDMYGEGKTGQTTEEKMALMNPLINNRPLLFQHILSAFQAGKNLEFVNSSKTGAIGFCFGGLCVLDLARNGIDITGVVSFHGALQPPGYNISSSIKAKMLVLQGHDDPMVPPEQVLAFEQEMTKEKADWQVHVYSNTKHAFTNPDAHNETLGTVYNQLTNQRSQIAMENFFVEIFR
jgi:dienelactone hydrolase